MLQCLRQRLAPALLEGSRLLVVADDTHHLSSMRRDVWNAAGGAGAAYVQLYCHCTLVRSVFICCLSVFVCAPWRTKQGIGWRSSVDVLAAWYATTQLRRHRVGCTHPHPALPASPCVPHHKDTALRRNAARHAAHRVPGEVIVRCARQLDTPHPGAAATKPWDANTLVLDTGAAQIPSGSSGGSCWVAPDHQGSSCDRYVDG